MLLSRPKRIVPGGFTLIELLVVVAIVALLISILLPALSRAKAQARQLLCLTNLRAISEAANFYAQENDDRLPRGIQMFTGDTSSEYHIFATAVIKYLGWDGDAELGIGGDANKLWYIRPKRRLNRIFRSIPQFQCPDYPDEVVRSEIDQRNTNPVDYVASAMPIPYTQENLAYDEGHLEWDPDDEYYGVPWGSGTIYAETIKLEDFPAEANPGHIIYVTEAHVSLPWQNWGPRLHHVFLGQQLPFSERPRIANDQRHPGGINALFFDGHGRVMDHHEMDPAWPNPLNIRLKWFTVLPRGFEDW